MKRIEIECISKDDRYSPTERITSVGGTNHSGSIWRQSVDQTIREIENEEWEFFVVKNNREVNVVVATSKGGTKYIKTEADDYEPNNLLELDECE